MTDDVDTSKEPTQSGGASSGESDNLMLRHLRGMRREMAVMLERQVRDRELLLRISDDVGRVRQDVSEIRRDIQELRSEMISLENKVLSGQNEVLRVMRRLDTMDVPADDEFGMEPPSPT